MKYQNIHLNTYSCLTTKSSEGVDSCTNKGGLAFELTTKEDVIRLKMESLEMIYTNYEEYKQIFMDSSLDHV